MKKEKIKILVSIIRLKKEFKEPRTISIGNKTIKAVPGEEVSVPRGETDMWLKKGKFDFVRFDESEVEVADEEPAEIPDETTPIESDLPDNIPAREILIREGFTFESVKLLDKAALVKIKDIGRNLADQILQFLNPETEETEGGDN